MSGRLRFSYCDITVETVNVRGRCFVTAINLSRVRPRDPESWIGSDRIQMDGWMDEPLCNPIQFEDTKIKVT